MEIITVTQFGRPRNTKDYDENMLEGTPARRWWFIVINA